MDNLLKSKEVCKKLSISPSTLSRLVSKGKIDYIKSGRTSPRKFKLADINNYLATIA